MEEANLTIADMEVSKRRLTTENGDLLHQLQELEGNANLLLKNQSSLVSALGEQKQMADEEAKGRVIILGKYRNMEHEIGGLKENFEEETSRKGKLSSPT